MFRKYLLFPVIFVAIILLVAYFTRSTGKQEQLLTCKAQKGPFESLVYSTGQLESVEADYIPVPEIFKDPRLRLSSLVIADMVDEGTYVDSGGYVATIDHSTVDEQQKTAIDELNRLNTELEDSKIDSNLTLSNQRDLIVNAQLEVEEKRIVIDESAFEAPSVKRKAEMDYEKSKRKLDQMNQAYLLKQQQEAGKVNRKMINYKQAQDLVDLFQEAYNALRITAPRAGAIGYFRYSGGGAPVTTTSTISVRSPAIATFPKMNLLVTNTYINEIDISKIKIGQKVTMGVDAFPEKVMYGEVANIANVGQLTPRSDAKVFEVKINVRGNDTDLKPSMTTSNIIQTAYAENAVFIPIEAIFRNDSLAFVYKLANQGRKISKQVVEPGFENESYVVIKQGLNEGDQVCLEEPDQSESIPLTGIEIYENLKKDSLDLSSAQPQAGLMKGIASPVRNN
jgi:multidrug efflux pump subunit AcrA (membrane-fusion protein)